jgi:hypothetical protein
MATKLKGLRNFGNEWKYFPEDRKTEGNKKSPEFGLFCGPDGTRTRDLLRDRQAF